MDPTKLANFNDFLHELRTNELATLRGRAAILLSAGCSGTWYFDWVRQCIGPSLRTHIGVEAYSRKPDSLPPEAHWIDNPIQDMHDVSDGHADLVFAGQTVEHLWPAEFVGFLREAHRVLRPGGLLVLDSPNRELTLPMSWYHPEHTMEFTVPEIRELVGLAGFQVTSLRGVWLCRERGSIMRLDPLPEPPEWEGRVDAARLRAEDSFVWWLEASREDRAPDIEELQRRVEEVYARTRPQDLARVFHGAGSSAVDGAVRYQESRSGEQGYLAYGPYAPFPPGVYVANFYIRTNAPRTSSLPACTMDIAEQCGEHVIASYQLKCSEVGQSWERWRVGFRFTTVRFGVEFRLFATGAMPLSVKVPIEVTEQPQ